LLPIHEKVSKLIFSSKNEVIKNTSKELNNNLPKATFKDIFQVSIIYLAVPFIILPLFL
jgi:hypothetical protein